MLNEVEAPKDSTYSGRNGNMLEKPIAVTNWAIKIIHRVRCQYDCAMFLLYQIAQKRLAPERSAPWKSRRFAFTRYTHTQQESGSLRLYCVEFPPIEGCKRRASLLVRQAAAQQQNAYNCHRRQHPGNQPPAAKSWENPHRQHQNQRSPELPARGRRIPPVLGRNQRCTSQAASPKEEGLCDHLRNGLQSSLLLARIENKDPLRLPDP